MTPYIAPHERKWLTACDTLATLFSTCSRRQYAAVVLATNKRVVGFGYNGAPPGMMHCVDGGCPRAFIAPEAGTNYDNCVAQHAEAGALLWADPAMRRGGTLIVNGAPCLGCAKLIASAGIARVIYRPDPTYAQWDDIQTFFALAGVDTLGAHHD